MFKQIFLPMVLCLCCVHPADAGPEHELVNRLRQQAGLPELVPQATLALAARQHAAYLDRHREPGQAGQGISAHEQLPDRPGFSGETPASRALAVGYPHREVLENVSMGYADAESAVSGLMRAIYHRLTFLDFEADSLGVAVGERSRVFLLGREDIGRLCEEPPARALSRVPVDCLGRLIRRKHYESLCATVPDHAVFRAPHTVNCPNGTLLDGAYMARVCAQPPGDARFRGHGRYYLPCDNGVRVDADWFDTLCGRPPVEAVYRASGQYFEICEPPVRVHAEWLEETCAGLPPEAGYTDSGRFRRPCAQEVDIRVEYLDELDAGRRSELPDVVLWPPPGAQAIPPAFFIEEPDPLPDLDVSGYPVSIQFNPLSVASPRVTRFELLRLDGESTTPVEPVRLMDRHSDPNQLLSAQEFALFPLQRLDWGASYRVKVEAEVDGSVRRLEWDFATAGADEPLLIAARQRQRFTLRPDRDHLLYLPPTSETAYTVLNSRVEHRRGNPVKVSVVDPNTLRVGIGFRDCDPVRLYFGDGRTVELLPEGCR